MLVFPILTAHAYLTSSFQSLLLASDLEPGRLVNSLPTFNMINVIYVQMYTLSGPDLLVRIILHIGHLKDLASHLYEAHVRSSSFLEAEIADGVCAYHLLHRPQQQRKGRFEVYAISCQEDVWTRRDWGGDTRSPFEDMSCYWSPGGIESDVVFQ